MTLPILIICVVFAITGCHALDGYERRYSIGYENREGERTDIGVTLIPKAKPVIREK